MAVYSTTRGMRPGVVTSTTRPTDPYIGQLIFETDTGLQRYWMGTQWSSGVKHGVLLPVEYLVIAGGGGGGNGTSGVGHEAGGGGAGGYRSSVAGEVSGGGATRETPFNLAVGTYSVTVGAGGNASTNGSDSSFHTITSLGGGRGGNGGSAGSAGGSGGGGAHNMTAAGAGTVGQGYAGFQPTAGSQGGGGGGAGAAATRIGGVGVASSITGTSVFRGGGGGGGLGDGTNNAGGNGGGGTGALSGNGSAGTTNTGGGGGGANAASGIGGAGGSGVVIVRYPTSEALGLTITGGTKTTAGTFTVHTFTSSGSLVIA